MSTCCHAILYLSLLGSASAYVEADIMGGWLSWEST